FFHFYGLANSDLEHVLDSFNLVRDRDQAEFGEYLTKRLILEIYDAMAKAQHTGAVYQTRLDPPPADPRVAHPARVQPTGVATRRISVEELVQIPAAAWATPD